MGDSRTDAILREWWHATAEAPRPYPGAREDEVDGDYIAGLDAMGALKAKVQPAPARTVKAAPPPAAPPSAPVVVDTRNIVAQRNAAAPPPPPPPPSDNFVPTPTAMATVRQAIAQRQLANADAGLRTMKDLLAPTLPLSASSPPVDAPLPAPLPDPAYPPPDTTSSSASDSGGGSSSGDASTTDTSASTAAPPDAAQSAADYQQGYTDGYGSAQPTGSSPDYQQGYSDGQADAAGAGGASGSYTDDAVVQQFRQGGADPFADEGDSSTLSDGLSTGDGSDDSDLDQAASDFADSRAAAEAALNDDNVMGDGGDITSLVESLLPNTGEYKWAPSSTPFKQGAASADAAARAAVAQQKLAAVRAQLSAAIRAGSSGGSAGATFSPGTSDFTQRLAQARQQYGVLDGGGAMASLSPDEVAGIVLGAVSDLIEEDQLHLDNWSQQITDAPPDPLRGRAPHHAGATYLDPKYPPGGSSHGQEGGSMVLEEKFQVFGGGIMDGKTSESYARGLDILGAGPIKSAAAVRATNIKAQITPRAGFVLRTTPAGKQITSLVAGKLKLGDHKKSIANARDIGKRAITVGNRLLAGLKATQAKAKATAVRGAGVPARHPITRAAKHPLSPAQIQKIAQAAVAAGNKLIKDADNHESFVKTADAKAKVANKTARNKSFIGGCDYSHLDAVLGAACDVAGGVEPMSVLDEDLVFGDSEIEDDMEFVDPSLTQALRIAGAEQLDEGRVTEVDDDIVFGDATADYTQGYTDGTNGVPAMAGASADYTQGYTDGKTDAAGGGTSVSAPAASASDPTGELAALGAPPTMDSVRADLKAAAVADPGPDTDANAYQSDGAGGGLPLGAVVFDGSRDFQNMDVGSFNYYPLTASPPLNAPPHNGFVLNQGGWWGGGVHHGSGWMAVRGGSMDTVDDSEAPDLSDNHRDPVKLQATSLKYNWGPLIGNPKTWARGLRFDPIGKQWFWFRDMAPASARQTGDQTALNQALLDYNAKVTAAKADNAAMIAQDQLDAQTAAATAKQQAADDANTAHQYQQEDTAAQHQADLQSAADQQSLTSAAAQQAAMDEASARQQQAQVETYRQQQFADIDVQARAAAAVQALQPPPDQGQYADQGAVDQGQYVDDQGDQGGGAFDPFADAGATDYTDQSDIVPNDGMDVDAAKAMLEDGTEVMGASARLRSHLTY